MACNSKYSKMPHSIWETNKLTWGEKSLLTFIIDRSNRFCKEDKYFNLSYDDFKKAGLDKRQLIKLRKTLMTLKLISYTEGHTGKGSTYRINWDNIENLSIEDSEEDKEETIPKDIQKPQEVAKNSQRCDEIIPPQLSEVTSEIINRRGNDFQTILKKCELERKYGGGYIEDADKLLHQVAREENVTQNEFDEMLQFIDYKRAQSVALF